MAVKERKYRSLQDPRHLMRYLRNEAGESAEDIARAEGVAITTVRQSIKDVDFYRKRNASIEMELAVRDFVISTVPKAKETLHGLLDAMELVEVKDEKTGKTRYAKVEDKTTRLEAERLFKDLIVGLQPKGAPVEVKVQQNNAPAVILSKAETMEERLDRLRGQAAEHNLLPPDVAGVPNHIDKDEDLEDEEDDEDDEPDEEGEEDE